MNKRKILVLVFLSEAALAGIFFIWRSFVGYQLSVWPSAGEALLGVLAALFLALVNYLTFLVLAERFDILCSSRELIDTVLRPLAKELGWFSAGVVSLLAGFGEELFFRGMLQSEFGVLLSGIAFSLMHFGPAARQYVFLTIFYAAIGWFFSLLLVYSGTIWVPIVAHAVYDYLALLYLKHVGPRR